MDLGGLRTLVRDLNFSAHGLAITVAVPDVDETPIETTGIWLTPVTDDVPTGAEFRRRDVRRVMALSKSDVDSVPRGTIIMAPESSGGTTQRWRVDGIDRVEAEHLRVVLVPDVDSDP